MKPGSAPASPKLFGRYHEIMLLLIGTLCGTVLGTYLQHLSWRYQHEENVRQAERVAAERIAEEVSGMMDRRLYSMRRVLWGCRDGRPGRDIEARWATYQGCLDEWNGSLNGTLVGLDRYFGTPVRTAFEQEVHAGIRWIGGRMERWKGSRRPPPASVDSLLAELDCLNAAAYAFNGQMLDAVRAGDLGLFLPAPAR